MTAAREAALAAVRRGHDLHYATGAQDAADAGRALLDGDVAYAEGLAALAADGDLQGVRALADLIADCARAHAEGRPADADAAWRETAQGLS